RTCLAPQLARPACRQENRRARSIAASWSICAGRRNHPGLRAAVHGIALAITAVARQGGHALLVAPEAAVTAAAGASTPSILSAPGIRDVGGGGLEGRRQAQERQGQKNDAHGSLLERDDFSPNRHLALRYCWSMIFSENRCPLFGIMLWS